MIYIDDFNVYKGPLMKDYFVNTFGNTIAKRGKEKTTIISSMSLTYLSGENYS